MNSHHPLIPCFAEVAWREVGEEPVPNVFLSSNRTCPGLGEVRWARLPWSDVTHAVAPVVGHKHWFLFEPPYPFINGSWYNDAPEELELCTLIEAEILELRLPQRRRDREAWIRSRCIRVVPLTQIPDLFPPIPLLGKRDTDLDAVSSHALTLYTTRDPEFQEWYIATNARASKHVLPRIVLSGTASDNLCYICNFVVETGKDFWQAV